MQYFNNLGSLRDWLNERNEEFYTNDSNQDATIPIRNEGKKGYPSEHLNKVLKYFKQILDAVKHYQSFKPPVFPRDLKPENILYDKSNDSFLISDLGLGRVLDKDDSSRSNNFTRGLRPAPYDAPDLFEGRYTVPSNHYPLGIILFEFLFPLQKEEDFLEEKLFLLNRKNTDTACEAMYHSLPQLCILITRMVSLKGSPSKPELSEIIQIIGSQITKTGVDID